MAGAARQRTTPAQPVPPRLPGPGWTSIDSDSVLESLRRCLGVQIATVRAIDDEEAELDADAGLEASLLRHETAFYRSTLAAKRPLIVPDACQDAGFSAQPAVAGQPHVRFYAGVPLFLASGRMAGVLGLFDTRPDRLSAADVDHVAASTGRLTPGLIQRCTNAALGRLRAEAAAKDALIREQAASLAHSRKIFDRASEAARIGVWECDLPAETLHWTDVVYDIFELPRGSALDRARTLTFYAPPSLRELEARRRKAIDERSSFDLDAEIVTAKGRRRWIRITATVESENGVPVRIFGMKQDITEEKLLWERTRYLAEFDVMTGLPNRSQFQCRLAEQDSPDTAGRPLGALALVDLDGFKQLNDTFGHAFGDECLREAARRLAAACRGADLVARIGGDEFAVLLGAHFGRAAAERLAESIVRAMSGPFDHGGTALRLGASVGIAHADGCVASELFTRADSALYAAKAAGRNTFRVFGPPCEQAEMAGRPTV